MAFTVIVTVATLAVEAAVVRLVGERVRAVEVGIRRVDLNEPSGLSVNDKAFAGPLTEDRRKYTGESGSVSLSSTPLAALTTSGVSSSVEYESLLATGASLTALTCRSNVSVAVRPLVAVTVTVIVVMPGLI